MLALEPIDAIAGGLVMLCWLIGGLFLLSKKESALYKHLYLFAIANVLLTVKLLVSLIGLSGIRQGPPFLSFQVVFISLFVLLFGTVAVAAFLKARHLHRKSKEEKEEEAEGGELR